MYIYISKDYIGFSADIHDSRKKNRKTFRNFSRAVAHRFRRGLHSLEILLPFNLSGRRHIYIYIYVFSFVDAAGYVPSLWGLHVTYLKMINIYQYFKFQEYNVKRQRDTCADINKRYCALNI